MKALYGLKQAPKAWYIKIRKYLVDQGFHWNPSDPNLYLKSNGNDIILLVLYVDDIIIKGNETHAIEKIKSNMCIVFEMTNLGLLHYYLGVEVWQIGGNIFVFVTSPLT